ncbi:MAG: permease prefix domain 1-containing protein [Rhodospirillaceae bacterium]|nr:permease prefix domain 1-containing protein [Rhodospirillaceae bacterium]
MSRPDFSTLSETLLRGGIAARHVQRYVRELGDHFDDLVREAMAGGKSASDAEHAAAARIGSIDQLARTMLTRDDLKSLGARYPWAVYGLAPSLLLACAILLSVLAYGAIAVALKPDGDSPAIMPDWIQPFIDGWSWLITYPMPIILAGLTAWQGTRQRIGLAWILTGTGLVGLIGGFHDIGVIWPQAPGGHGEIRAGLGIEPNSADFAGDVVQAVLNISIATALAVCLKRGPYKLE